MPAELHRGMPRIASPFNACSIVECPDLETLLCFDCIMVNGLMRTASRECLRITSLFNAYMQHYGMAKITSRFLNYGMVNSPESPIWHCLVPWLKLLLSCGAGRHAAQAGKICVRTCIVASMWGPVDSSILDLTINAANMIIIIMVW